MLIYEYPPKLNRAQKQAKAAHDLQEHSKMRRNMYKNLALGAVIIAISFFADVMLIKILLILIGGANIAVGLLIYMYYSLSRNATVYTRIYDDRIEHSQPAGMTKKFLHIILYYDEIKSSAQSTRGRLICTLGDIKRSSFYIEGKDGTRSEFSPKDNEIALSFQDVQAKLKLVNELYEKIKYPHKEYKEISDEDDYYSEEDMKWDGLHKHGL